MALVLVVSFRVVLELNPFVEITMSVLALSIKGHVIIHHHLNVLLFQIFLHFLEHSLLRVTELCPYLNSEEVFTARCTLVQESDTCKHVNIVEFTSDHIENKLFPEYLEEDKMGFEVHSELATLLVHFIFVGRVHFIQEQAESIDSGLFIVYHHVLDFVIFSVIEQVLEVFVWDRIP